MPVADGGVSHINDKQFPIRANSNIGAKHGQYRMTQPPIVCRYIHIIPDNGYVCQILEKLPDTITVKDTEKYSLLFNDILDEYNKSAHNANLSVYGRFLTLLSELQKETTLSPITFPKHSNVNTKAIELALNYIDENYMNKLTLEKLSQEVFLSPIYFRQLFYDIVGVSPYEYILDKRIEQAKHSLTVTNMSIADISLQSGFSEQSYFGKVFKEKTGRSPLAYRKIINGMYP